jgi:hypothetical protein
MFFMFVLTLTDGLYCAWFISCVGAEVGREGLALSIGPNRVSSIYRWRQCSVSGILCVLNKNRRMDNVQKHKE